jgi:putative ABC transport system substrate-binding protein
MPLIGFPRSSSIERSSHLIAAFLQGLKETGHFEAQNVAIEYRSAEGHYDRLPALAADLVRRGVNSIVATGGYGPARPSKSELELGVPTVSAAHVVAMMACRSRAA